MLRVSEAKSEVRASVVPLSFYVFIKKIMIRCFLGTVYRMTFMFSFGFQNGNFEDLGEALKDTKPCQMHIDK